MLAALSVIAVLTVAAVDDVPDPRPRHVTDAADVLDPAAEQRLEALAAELQARRGPELVVVTVDDVAGSPKGFASALFGTWALGTRERDDGVLVLLVMKQRRLEIETGVGMEAPLPAWWLAEMQARDMVPRFKQGAFGAGLEAGVTAIVARLDALPAEGERDTRPGEYRSDGVVTAPPAGAPTPAGPRASAEPPPGVVPSPAGPGAPASNTAEVVAGAGGAAGVGGLGALLLWRRRKKQRTCAACALPMRELDELADDAHLDAGQRAEERLGAVDYHVLICPGCQASRVLRDSKWFSGRSTCTSCRYKTLGSTSTTLVHATYDHGGKVQVTEDCGHCAYHNTYTRSTPRRTRPSTSSSGGSRGSRSSGGFGGGGGGRSRGGGAGSSW